MQAWEAKDIDALIGLLDPDATAIADGGDRAITFLDPVEGAEQIAQAWLEIARRRPDTMRFVERRVNGQPGLIAQQDGVVVTVFAFEIDDDRIKHIWVVRNPESSPAGQQGEACLPTPLSHPSGPGTALRAASCVTRDRTQGWRFRSVGGTVMAMTELRRLPLGRAPGWFMALCGVLLVGAFPITVWWLVGQQTLDVPDPDYAQRPWAMSTAAEAAIGGTALLVLVVTALLFAGWTSAGRTGPSWWYVLVPLLAAGLIAGVGQRVVTAEVIGANIGAGMVLLVGVPVAVLLVGFALVRLLLEVMRRSFGWPRGTGRHELAPPDAWPHDSSAEAGPDDREAS
ncbi:hypothetical protein P8605_17990 [Streptomyces sp. T-3]|nr:hypothetical protein [Streptomyces sp. T-3]